MWKPIDFVALLLALGVLTVVMVPAVRTATTGVPLAPQGVEIIGELTMAMVALLGAYIGTKHKGEV